MSSESLVRIPDEIFVTASLSNKMGRERKMPANLQAETETVVQNMLVSRDERIRMLEDRMLELTIKVHEFKHQGNMKREKEDETKMAYVTPEKSQRSRWADMSDDENKLVPEMNFKKENEDSAARIFNKFAKIKVANMIEAMENLGMQLTDMEKAVLEDEEDIEEIGFEEFLDIVRRKEDIDKAKKEERLADTSE